jgi:hypothetical protein
MERFMNAFLEWYSFLFIFYISKVLFYRSFLPILFSIISNKNY